MTSENMIQYVSDTLQNVIYSNDEAITRQILKDFGPNDSREVMYSKMIANAIDISAQISVQTIFFTLEKLGVITLADIEKADKHQPLELVWDFSKNNESDN